MVSSSNRARFSTIFSVLVACLPFLYQYATPIPVLSLGEAALLPFIFYYLAIDLKSSLEVNKYCGFYLLMVLIILNNFLSFIAQPYGSFQESVTVLVRLAYYSVLIYVGYRRINIGILLITLIVGAMLNSLYTLVQYVSHIIFGLDLPTTLPFIPVFSEENLQGRTNLAEHYRYFFRPSGLFLEPSYAAFYSAPGLLISLLHSRYSNKVLSLVSAIVITLGLIAGTSSMALIPIVLGWGGFVLRRLVSRDCRGQIVVNPLGFFSAIILCSIILLVLLSPLGELTLGRLNIAEGSAGQRVIRGWMLAARLDFKTLIIGTGLNNVSEFVSYFGVTTQFDESNLDYLSSWSSALVSSGIFALMGYALFFGRLLNKQRSAVGKTFVLLFIATGFVEAMLYTYRFSFYLVIAFSLMNETRLQHAEELVLSTKACYRNRKQND